MLFLLGFLLFTASPFSPDVPRVAAAPAADMSVDGTLNEAAWEAAAPATGFVQFEPTEGAPASQQTRVRVLYAADALYIGAEMLDSRPDLVRQTLSRRDDRGNADAFTVGIDSYNDGRTARLFGVTAAGVQFDAILEGDDEDDSWDAVWASGVRVTPTGWTAELRIPYSQLRFSGRETSWGINFVREVPRLGEESYWSPFSREQADSGIVQFFGQLDGIAGVRPRRLVQAVPYTLASGARGEDPARLGRPAYDAGFDTGADFKIGLTPSVILDATINPDFGQVEADPAELNLSTFETFFSERRPFFLEGTQIFDNGFSRDGALVYTRRIGGASPLIAATKLTGRTARGLSFGGLAAATGEDFDPTRFYGVARLRQEIGEQNYVGATGSVFDATRGQGGARSAVGAVDWRYRVGRDDAYQAEGVLAGSLRDDGASGENGFALYVGFDQVKGYSRFGSGFRVYSPGFQLNDVGRFRETDRVAVNGALIQLWNEGNPFGPFQRLNTFLFSSAAWTYSDGVFRGADAGLSSSGELKGFRDVSFNLSLDGLGGLDVRETRGLGPIQNLASLSASGSISTDTRRNLVAEFGLSGRVDREGGYTIGPEADIDWTASDRVQFRLSAEVGSSQGLRAWAANEGFVRTGDGRLYIGNEASNPSAFTAADVFDTGLSSTDATALLDGFTPIPGLAGIPNAVGYYAPLFGRRDYRSGDLTLRTTVIFRPTISLQLYSQLFAARGQYRDFQLLAAEDELRDFGAYPKRRDFSFASFNANAVFRWEYRPGSSLFVVWQRGMDDDLFEEVRRDGSGPSPFERDALGQVGDLFGRFADDIVLVKLSYLLSR
ncbi:DUF5916 domain-containing protein [Rubricoccus marinus]|uniref:DUF5916 domain-containing protein n=1 Tax=Rubricoccus marinus TaxID=716817 RepID=A0A259TYQ1_9BACT|nr:DUF5916 domain-containing protein [Rubricoccus marinus]OZC02747.1 hypothetical protein BSZ36_07035 [Rubricoccus marinus]